MERNEESMVGLSVGPMCMQDVVVWYDCPIVWTARGAVGVPYLIILTDEDTVAKTQTWLVMRISEAQIKAFSPATAVSPCINAVSLHSISKHGGAIQVITDYAQAYINDEWLLEQQASDLMGEVDDTLPTVTD